MYDYANEHPSVLQAAVFGAVADIGARLCWFYPHEITAIGDHIGFAGELWHPETVRDVRGLELQESRTTIARLGDRHVQLIRSHNAKVGIANFPPPLMTQHGRVHRARRRKSALHIVNRACRSQSNHNHNQNWDHGPGKLDLIAAVHLRRLEIFMFGPPSKAKDGRLVIRRPPERLPHKWSEPTMRFD